MKPKEIVDQLGFILSEEKSFSVDDIYETDWLKLTLKGKNFLPHELVRFCISFDHDINKHKPFYSFQIKFKENIDDEPWINACFDSHHTIGGYEVGFTSKRFEDILNHDYFLQVFKNKLEEMKVKLNQPDKELLSLGFGFLKHEDIHRYVIIFKGKQIKTLIGALKSKNPKLAKTKLDDVMLTFSISCFPKKKLVHFKNELIIKETNHLLYEGKYGSLKEAKRDQRFTHLFEQEIRKMRAVQLIKVAKERENEDSNEN
jgi:hypothetical protein